MRYWFVPTYNKTNLTKFLDNIDYIIPPPPNEYIARYEPLRVGQYFVSQGVILSIALNNRQYLYNICPEVTESQPWSVILPNAEDRGQQKIKRMVV